MKHAISIVAGASLLLVGAGSLAAQETDTTAGAAPPAEAAPASQPAHDWEFALAASERAPGASATVMVDNAESGSDFVVVANGLPNVDSLDEEGRDVNAYTVWIVPSKEKVPESELAGVLTVSPEGTGRFEGNTPMESFGIAITATPDGAPQKISGIPVLTGIPVQAGAAEESAEEAAEEAGEAAVDAAEAAGQAGVEAAEQAAESAEEVAEEVDEGAEAAAEEAAAEADEPAPAPEPAPDAPPAP